MPTASAKSISAAPTSCSAITKCRKLRLRSWTATGSTQATSVFSSGRMPLSHRQKEECHRHENGENIYPEEIEIIVNNHPFISDCMVYAAQKDGSDIVAVQIIPNMENIMSKLGKEPTPEELQKLMKNIIGDINETMSSYKRIRSIVIRKEDFVRTTTKKIIRKDNIES